MTVDAGEHPAFTKEVGRDAGRLPLWYCLRDRLTVESKDVLDGAPTLCGVD